MYKNRGNASSSVKGAVKSTRKAARASKKAAKQFAKLNLKSQADDIDTNPSSEIITSLGLGVIDDLLPCDDSSSELSADSYDKLSGENDLLLNDTELSDALREQVSILKLQNARIQQTVVEIKSYLELTNNKGQSSSTKPSNNASQVPDVITTALKPPIESCSTVDESKVKQSDAPKKPATQKAPRTKNEQPKQILKHRQLPPVGNKKGKKHTQDVIYVKPSAGLTFLDLLRVLRSFDPHETPFMMDTPRRVKDGVLLLPIKRSADSAKVESVVRAAIGDIGKVTMTTPMTILISTNFDRLFIAKDLQEAILKHFDVEVKLDNVQLEKTRKSRQRARIRIAIRDARKLEGNQLLIGRSTVTFRTEIPTPREEERCFRCMGLGHRAKQCQESQMLCYRCGTGGHKASGCKNMPKCLICNGGHQTGTRKCQSSSAEGETTVKATSEKV